MPTALEQLAAADRSLSVRRQKLVLQWRPLAFKFALRFWRWLASRGTSRISKASLVSAAMYGLVYAAGRFDDRGAFSSYAYPCIRGWLLTEIKRQLRDPVSRAWPLWAVDVIDPASLRPADRDLGDVVAGALRFLRPRERDMIRLRFWDGWTYQEIGERHDISKCRVMEILNRSLRKMRGELAGQEELLLTPPHRHAVVMPLCRHGVPKGLLAE